MTEYELERERENSWVTATPAEAVAEYARNYGMDNLDEAWILSPHDTWEPNPFFRGDRGVDPETAIYLAECEAEQLEGEEDARAELMALEHNDLESLIDVPDHADWI